MYDKISTKFKCKICGKKGKCEDGYYVCLTCKGYAVHLECPN